MQWKIAEAKRRFSELLHRTADEPQLIFNRDRMVAVVVDSEAYQAFREWQERPAQRPLADWAAELRAICTEEEYSLEIAVRQDRHNPFG